MLFKEKTEIENYEWIKQNVLKQSDLCLQIINEYKFKDEYIAVDILYYKGLILNYKGAYFEAYQALKKGIAITQKKSFNKLLAKFYATACAILGKVNKYELAISYAHKCIELNIDEHKGVALNTLKITYKNIGEKEKQLKYQEKLKKLNQKLQDHRKIMFDYLNDSQELIENGKPDEAISHLNESIKFSKKHKLGDQVLGAYANLSHIYIIKNKYKECIKLIDKALQLEDSLTNRFYSKSMKIDKVHCLFKLKRYEEAYELSKKVQALNYRTGKHSEDHFFELLTKLAKELPRLNIEDVYKLQIENLQNKIKVIQEKEYKDLITFREQELDELQKKNSIIQSQSFDFQIISKHLSHGLKTPVRNVSSFANIIKTKIANKAFTETEELLGFIENYALQIYNSYTETEKYLNYKKERSPKSKVKINSIIENVRNKNEALFSHFEVHIKNNAFINVKVKSISKAIQCLFKYLQSQKTKEKVFISFSIDEFLNNELLLIRIKNIESNNTIDSIERCLNNDIDRDVSINFNLAFFVKIMRLLNYELNSIIVERDLLLSIKQG